MRFNLRKIIGAVLLAILLLTGQTAMGVQAAGQQFLVLPSLSDVICKSYLAYDMDTDSILVSSKENERVFPASMTKIMTAALALEYLTSDMTLSTSQAALDGTTRDSSLMGLGLGEQVTFMEMMYGLMLPSGNDAANVLAEAVVDAAKFTDAANPEKTKLQLFADMMNQKASELGLTGTNFVNAHGLHDENHYTTAMDLARIFEYAMEYEEFLEIIYAPSHAFKATNLHTYDGWLISRNSNYLMTDPWILGQETTVARVLGGKTGTTSAAGSCLIMLSQNKNGHYMISVVAGIPYGSSSSVRMATFMAAVMNAGAQTCYFSDPEVRVHGDVMTNAPRNLPAGWIEATIPTEAPPEETGSPDASELTNPGITQSYPDGSSGAQGNTPEQNPLSLSDERIVLIAGVLLLVAIVVCIVILRQIVKSRRRGDGIRRL